MKQTAGWNLRRRRETNHEPLFSIYSSASRDRASDHCHRPGGRRGLQPACRFRRCRKWISQPSRCQASLPGASPEIMASSVATPLERQFGRIAAVTEMTSSSSLGQTSITLQFDLSRNIDAAARDVEAAINAARGYLPANLPSNPTYRKVNPADAPIMIIALTSNKLKPPQLYDAASTILMQRISQIRGVGQVIVGGSSAPAVRVDLNPTQVNHYGLSLENRCEPPSPPKPLTKPKAVSPTACTIG